MKKLFFILPVAIISFIILTGQKTNDDSPRWNEDPRTTSIYPTGVYSDLPADNTPEIKQFTYETRNVITPIGVFGIEPNFRLHPSSVSQQNETDISRHPTNPNIMFAAAQPIRNTNNFINAGVYVTTDGGVTWRGRDTMNAPNLNDQRGDPAPVIDINGNFIYGHLTSSSNFGSLTGMGANYSTDNGVTWSATFPVMLNSSVDKNMIGTDGSPTSPFAGNTYMAWTVLAGTTGNGRVSRTTNGGVSWDPVITLNSTPAGHFAQGHDVAVAPNGDVFVCWTAGVGSSPFTADFVGVAKSTDGGVTYTATENAYDVNGTRSFNFNGWGIRVADFPRIDIDKSGGPRNGWIYIMTNEFNLAPAGSDADVIMHRSTDGGATWSAGIRVNQDPLNNGKSQFLPVISVDDAGGLNVIYYDNRDFPSVNDSCSVYMSRSIDGGNTWTDVEVADHHFKPKNLPGINTMGDYIGVTSGNGKVWPVWMDDKAGPGVQFNIWSTSVQVQTFPLNAYNLNTPAAGARIQTLPNSTAVNTFTWDTSASTASYKWIFGSPTTSPRLITLAPSGNTLNVTSGELDNLLAGLGLAQGDSLVGQWDVWAFRNNAENDSMKASNGPRSITLKRGRPALTAFNLSSPPNNTTLLTLVTNTTPVNITWTKSGQAVTYKWLYATPNFSSQSNIKFNVPSANNGFDSTLTFRNSQVDSLLAGLGVAVGDSAVGQWRVYGYSAGDSLASAQTYNLTVRRGIPPTVTSSLDSIVINLMEGQTGTRNLLLGNTGQFDLNWNMSESSSSTDIISSNNIFTEEQIAMMANQPKGSADLFHGEEQTDGMGGPDAGGYRWIDSDEPGGPAYNWVEISTTGTAITGWAPTADDGSVVLPLPFTFKYYGNDYTSLKVVTNGWMGFDVASTNNAYSNVSIPATAVPNNCLYPFWDDLDLRTSGAVYYLNDAANNRFIVEYKAVPHYSTGELYTFQVMIYADGRIFYQYQDMNASLVNSCTIGTENSTGTTGLQVVYNAAYLHNNLAIKIEKGLAWVDENPSTGTITPGGNQNVAVNFNTVGLVIGSYTGVLNINSNDPINPVKTVNLRLNVGVVGTQNNVSSIPTEFDLQQNYPNPFNPVTKINFSIPRQGHVTLKIYDVSGKEVMTLLNETRSVGNYEVDFDGSNLASGVYFYRLESGDFKDVKRLMLIK